MLTLAFRQQEGGEELGETGGRVMIHDEAKYGAWETIADRQRRSLLCKVPGDINGWARGQRMSLVCSAATIVDIQDNSMNLCWICDENWTVKRPTSKFFS